MRTEYCALSGGRRKRSVPVLASKPPRVFAYDTPMPHLLHACQHRKAISTSNRMRERDILLQLSVDQEGVSSFVFTYRRYRRDAYRPHPLVNASVHIDRTPLNPSISTFLSFKVTHQLTPPQIVTPGTRMRGIYYEHQ